MRKLMFALFAGMVIVSASCIKDDTVSPSDCAAPVTAAAPTEEISALKAYLDSNHITATQDKRGFFYTIDSSAGAVGGYPIGCSVITVSYVGKLTNKTTFDSSASYSNQLSALIIGWREAIPFMKANATMNLYLPPSLAYGPYAQGNIPANSILIFNIKLLNFN